MLRLADLREAPDHWIQRLNKRGIPAKELVDSILDLDRKHRDILQLKEQKQAELNALSKAVGQFIREGSTQQAEEAKQKTGSLKAEIPALTEQELALDAEIKSILLSLPNAPHSSVPDGNDASSNVVVRSGNSSRELWNGAEAHWDLVARKNWIDFEAGVKVTGAGFPVYWGKAARLQRALIQYFLDFNTQRGYTEVQVPFMVNQDSGFGTGQLPDKEGQMYHATADDFYLIPTAEVPVTNLFRDTILDETALPIKCTAYSPCFRREAGSYGKDVRGLNRLHQFDKVEIVHICQPEFSYQVLDQMVNHVEELIQSLDLPYRLLRLCGGDMGFASALTYDFEVFSGAQQRWLEVSSVSNFEAFQSNRLKLRFRTNGKPQLLHTLNGSSLALPRILAAILEHHQTPEGVHIPEALQKYTGFDLLK
ncbi:MAG: serine--tRNA ligase [Bacteroidetes bacterium]|nr:serine--tRNA ligase [Bacteroidota bacterium]